MESELERFHKQNTQLELNITELRQKLKATDKEMHQERQKVRSLFLFRQPAPRGNKEDFVIYHLKDVGVYTFITMNLHKICNVKYQKDIRSRNFRKNVDRGENFTIK